MSNTRLQNFWQSFIHSSDRYSLQWIFQEVYPDLYRYGMRFTSSEEDVKDALQEVFINIWSYRKTLPTEVNVKAYLVVSLKHQLLKKKGYLKFELLTSDHERFFKLPSETESFDPSIKEIIKSKINALPERQREILYLKYFEELSYDEIALILNIQYQSVVNQAHRAISKLRRDQQLGRLVAFRWKLT